MADVGQVHLDLLAALILKGFLAEQVDVNGGAVVQLGRDNAGADGGAELDLHVLEDLEVVGVFQIALGDEDHGGLAVLAGQLERLFPRQRSRRCGRTRRPARSLPRGCPSYSPASKSNRPGASMRLYLMPSYSTGTTDADRLALRFASSGSKSETVVPSSTRPIRSAAPEKIDQCLSQRCFAAAGMACNQDIADVVACVFHIGFFPLSAARSILSAFVAYFTKIIPHSKQFSNRLLEKSFFSLPNFQRWFCAY